MAIFTKKYNIEKDHLGKRFDSNKREYYYTKLIDGKEYKVDFNELDRKSKKYLLEQNRLLLTDQNLFNEEMERYQSIIRSKYLRSIGYSCDSFEVLGDVQGTASRKMEEYLDTLLNEENVLVGIHRVGDHFTAEIMKDIFENGLKITGHMGGAVNSKRALRDNVSYYPSNKKIKKELMYADAYKNSTGSILIKIPDNALESDEDVYIVNGTDIRLNPKYIIGYVPLYPNHHIENIINNQNFYENEDVKRI